MATLYLIDVSGFIFRAYYALPPLTRPDGTPVGAVYGFCNMLLKLREMIIERSGGGEEVLWAGVFDVARQNFRHAIDANYKSNRKETPADLAPQFPLIREACAACGCPVVEYAGAEADDVIATLAREAAAVGTEVVVVSSDKDLMQLHGPRVRLFDPMKRKWIESEDIVAKFGVDAAHVVDVQALAGDASDGIRGVPGVGPKTAAGWIRQFGSLESLLENARSLPQKNKQTLLLAHAEDARIAKRLALLDAHLPIHLADFDLAFPQHWPAEAHVRMNSFFEAQGFMGLKQRFEPLQLARNNAEQKPTWQEILTIVEWDAALAGLPAGERVAIVPVAASKVFPEPRPFALMAETGTAYLVRLEADDQREALRSVLASHPVFAEDIKGLWHAANLCAAAEFAAFEDVRLIAYALLGGQIPESASGLWEAFLHKAPGSDWDAASVAVWLAENIFALYKVLSAQLQAEPALEEVYRTIDRPTLWTIFQMEQAGVHLNTHALEKIGQTLDAELQELEKGIVTCAGTEFNLASPAQLGEVLFEKLQLPPPKKSKKGQFLTDNATLSQLAFAGDFPIVEMILRWRRLFKLRSTYVRSLIDCVNPETRRVHSTFSLTNTNTGRLASAHPNLQNIPIRTPEGSRIRETFCGEDNSFIASFDYSQIELRLLAYMGEVRGLVEAFEEGQDVHAITAARIFHLDLDHVDAEARRRAKTVNFGVLYGQSTYGLALQLRISRSEAQRIIRSYFDTYPEIVTYMDRCKECARQKGYVETLFKRRCFIPDIHSKNVARRQFAERQAMNAPLQGTNADIIKRAMVRLSALLPSDVRLILQIHDELLFEGPQARLNACADMIQKEMSSVLRQAGIADIPLVVHFNIARNWAEAH